MEPDTLKELLTVFRELGTEAKGAFIWYLFFAYLPSILWTFGGIGLLWGLLRVVVRMVQESWWETSLDDVCNHSGSWTYKQKQKMFDCLKKHYHEETG